MKMLRRRLRRSRISIPEPRITRSDPVTAALNRRKTTENATGSSIAARNHEGLTRHTPSGRTRSTTARQPRERSTTQASVTARR
jgi:hypothetical protein